MLLVRESPVTTAEARQGSTRARLAPRVLAALGGGLAALAWFRAGVVGRWVSQGLGAAWDRVREATGVTEVPSLAVGGVLGGALAVTLLLAIRREPRGRATAGAAAADTRVPSQSPAWYFVIGALAVAVVAILTAMAARARYPLDLLLWSESSFLQDMLKLHQGLCPYQSADDNNSFVYNLGAPLVTWAIASACGGYRSLGFCRWLQIAFSLAACGLAAFSLWQLTRRESEVRRRVTPMAVALGLFTVVGVLNPVTAPFVDLLHNDALVLLTCAAGLAALASYGQMPRTWWFVLAVPLPALAVLMKQTGYVVWVGLVAGVAIQERRLKPALGFALASGLLIASASAALAVWSHGWWSFWTVRVLSKQQIVWSLGIAIAKLAVPALAPLAVICAGCAVWAARRWRTDRARTYLAVLLYGALLTGASAATSFKYGTAWSNHWGAACLVMVTLGAASVALALGVADGWPSGRWANAAAAAWLLFAAAALHQWDRNVPTPDHYRYAAHLNQAFRAKAPERTLLDHGTVMYLLCDVVPRDRGNTVLEAVGGGLGKLDATVDRIMGQQYDRILIHDKYGPVWYGRDVMRAVEKAYELKARIPGVPGAGRTDYLLGYLMTDVLVFEPKPLPPAGEAPAFVLLTDPGAYSATGRPPQEVRVRFSRPMDPATVTGDSVRLLVSDRRKPSPTLRPVPASAVRFEAQSNSAVITTPAALPAGLYWIHVTDTVRDDRGLNISGKSYRAPFTIERFVAKPRFGE